MKGSKYFWSSAKKGLIFGPLLFNNFLADFFFAVDDVDIASYTKSNSTYASGNDIEKSIQSLEEASNSYLNGLQIT